MIVCETIQEAQAVLGVVHIEVGATIKAYVQGDTLPSHMTAPSAAGTVAAAIRAERDRRKVEGGYSAGGKWFHSDTFSRTQQIGLVFWGASIPANTPWKTMDGSFVIMTQALAGQVFAAAAAQDIATFAAAEAHMTAVQASPDPAAYDFSGGWPTIFGG